MNCPKCEAENQDNARLCISCGQVFTHSEPQARISAPKTAKSATAALVLGILSPFSCMITALPAMIMGIVAIVKINRYPQKLKGNGLAIAGICLPVALLPVMAMLMGILMPFLMPALVRTRHIAYRKVCEANLSGIGKAMIIYSGDYDEKFPTPSKWCDLLIEKTGITPINFQCKGAGKGRCNFALNRNVEILGTSSPPDMVLLFETYPGWNQVGGPEILSTQNHNGQGCNVLFVDNHVEFVKKSSLGRLRWTDSPVPVTPRPQGSFTPRTPRQLPEEPRIDFPEAPPTRVVEILGDVPGVDFSTWQNTGVSLMADDVLYIQAEGEVNYVNQFTLPPDGRGNTFYPSLLPDISFTSLIGKTHFNLLDDGFDSSDTGIYGPGFVGSEFKTTYRGLGDYGLTGDNVLYLAVNDSMDNDNSLSFTVKSGLYVTARSFRTTLSVLMHL
ncbi:MAG: DUF4190 domain-containing protein [Planctomycetes bacterium]|nr:DUF4190 domain-containing protein [Planctomycetota bacterium]